MTKRSEIFKNHFFESLKELSDRDYQERIWINRENPEGLTSSFTEAAIQFWDDSLVQYSLKEKAIVYDRKVTLALQELWNAIKKVDEFRPEEEIINDPLMQQVREKAAEILALIKASDKSENTVTFIEEGTLKVLEP